MQACKLLSTTVEYASHACDAHSNKIELGLHAWKAYFFLIAHALQACKLHSTIIKWGLQACICASMEMGRSLLAWGGGFLNNKVAWWMGENIFCINKFIVMMRFYFLIFIALPFVLKGETNKRTIKISVLDFNSAQPISYAHVVIQNKNLGTITNKEGKVDFKIDSIHRNDTIVISSIGYQDKILPIRSMNSNNRNQIKLSQQTYSLEGIDVNLNVSRKIVLDAIRNISRNLPAQEYYYNGYFMTAFVENDGFKRLLEASIGVTDNGIDKRNGVKAKVNQLRKSLDFRNYKWDEGNSYLADCLFKDPIRARDGVLDSTYIDLWKFKLDDIYKINDEQIFNISFSLKEKGVLSYDGNISIRQSDHAILKMRFRNNFSLKKVKVNDSVDFVHLSTIIVVVYKDFGDKLIKSHQSLIQKWIINDKQMDQAQELTLLEDFITYDQGYGKNSRNGKRLKKNMDIYRLKIPYDKDFWRDFNTPVDTESLKLAKDELHSKMNLENQFEINRW